MAQRVDKRRQGRSDPAMRRAPVGWVAAASFLRWIRQRQNALTSDVCCGMVKGYLYMPSSSVIWKGQLWLFLFLLLGCLEPDWAIAQKQLPGQVPAVVAQGAVAREGRMPGTNLLRLAFSLPVRNGAELTNFLAALYRPGSPQFHHYLKPREFAARFGPSEADYEAILQFARTNGLAVTGTHSNRLVVDVTGKVSDVERALRVQLWRYRHFGEPRDFFAPDRNPIIDSRLPLLHVSGLDDFASPRPNVRWVPAIPGAQQSPSDGSSPLGTFMGNDFRQAYVPGSPLTGTGQNVALVQFDDYYSYDVTAYENTIGLTNLPALTTIPVDGGIGSPGGWEVEVVLDIDMVLSMSPGVSNIFVYEAPNSVNSWPDILSQIANDDLAAQVSCSWSGGEDDPAAEQIFQQMAAQGQSFFNAAGDGGAYTNVVAFPCSSPNITEVGGTYLATDTNGVYAGESVWQAGNGSAGSGGIGLSVHMPLWQMGVDMSTNGGSAVWRNIPDVALTAAGVFVIVNGQPGQADGTSCAAPLWAGFTALVNQQASQLGEPPVGFLNPAIYSLCRSSNYLSLFNDITYGNNTNLVNGTNFFAVPGYDLCTGWGTPTGTNLINALTSPDPLGIVSPAAFFASGMVGGPFSETNWVVTVTNSGRADLAWTLSSPPSWLEVSATNGILPGNSFTNLTLQLADPTLWPAAGYLAALTITNLNSSLVQNIMVEVEVGQSIVVNGGFETGDFTGWTLMGDTITYHNVCNIVATDADYPGVVHTGDYGAFLGEIGYAASLSQALPTVPGQIYLVSFWLDNVQAGGGQTFSAFWNNTNYIDLESPSDFTWSNFQFVVTAETTNDVLEFFAENDANYFGFDDVTVTPVPPVFFLSDGSVTNGFQLSWPSAPGLNYAVQSATDLGLGDWQNICTVTAATNVSSFVDTNYPALQQGFYRLVLLP